MSFHQPATLEAALGLVAEPGARVIAGGTDLYPSLKPGQGPAAFVDITRVAGMRGISRNGDLIRMGAATTWTDIIRADLPPAFDGLKAAAREVGSVQIQNTGTVAGNLCNASPAADGVPPLLTLEAEVEISSAARGTRHVPLAQFITHVRRTALRDDEMVSALTMPAPSEAARGGFAKLGSRRYLVISIAMTAVYLRAEGGQIAEARVAVGACSPVAMRLPALEADLVGQPLDALKVDPAHLSGLSPIDDVRGSAAYRQEVVAVQIARALREAAA